MSVNLSPLGGAGWQFFDNNGVPLSGGFLYTYAAGTTTPTATYTSNSGSVAQANPIVLDASGRIPNEMWLTTGTTYKFVLQTSSAVQIGSYDNVSGINDLTSANYTPSITGGVTRSFISKIQEIISVKDFGATGLGTSNDATYISTANTNSSSLLFPPGTYLITSNITLTSACTFLEGASLNINSGVTVTFNGAFNSGVYQIFQGSGSVLFGNESAQEIFPEWWGAVAVGSNTSGSVLITPNDCTSAINSAIASVSFNYQPSGKIIKFQVGVYGISSIHLVSTTNYLNGLTFRGNRSTQFSGGSVSSQNRGGATVLQSLTSSSYLFNLDATGGAPIDEIHFEDLVFDGMCQKSSVFLMSPATGGTTYVIDFIYFDRCVWTNVKNNSYLISSNVSNAHAENALIYFNQCSFLLNSALQTSNVGISVFLQNDGAWQWQFHQCYFSGTSQTGYGSIYVQTGGIELNNCYFEANNNYDIVCQDGGWVHAHDCMTNSAHFASFATYSGSLSGYTAQRGIVMENIIFPQNTGSWMIISDATNSISLKNLLGGGVYLRSGSGNAYIENVVNGTVEFGTRADLADTYTGTATLINVPVIKTNGSSANLVPAPVTIVEGTDATVLERWVGKDLLTNLSVTHVAGSTAFYVTSYIQGTGYAPLYIRASNIINDAGSFQTSVAGSGLYVYTPDGTKRYLIGVNNSGAVTATLS